MGCTTIKELSTQCTYCKVSNILQPTISPVTLTVYPKLKNTVSLIKSMSQQCIKILPYCIQRKLYCAAQTGTIISTTHPSFNMMLSVMSEKAKKVLCTSA